MKIVFLGAAKCGKSCILSQMLHETFNHRYKATVEDSFNHVVRQPDGLVCVLDIFDTSGTNEFPVMRELRIKEAEVFVVVYSVTSRATFDYAVWMCQTVKKIKQTEDIPIILVGNKIDLTSERVVTYDEGFSLVKECSTGYFIETSARNDDNIASLMDLILIQRDSNRDTDDLRRRLSSISSSKRVSDPSFGPSLDHDFLSLWNTRKMKTETKKCSIM